MLERLRSEKMLAVDSGASLPADVDPASVPTYDLPPRDIDTRAQAIDESRRLDAEIAATKALLELERKREELAKLKAKLTNT
jgi:hypothetical protein